MCKEVLEIVQGMDRNALETQLVLQCAPVISRLKASNLLNIGEDKEPALLQMLTDSGLLAVKLLTVSGRSTFLVYEPVKLEKYFHMPAAKKGLKNFGYKGDSLEEWIQEFGIRFQTYMLTKQEFPHEVGYLLGYPVEDVEGFVKYHGQNYLAMGYWKVYGHASAKLRLFAQMENEKEYMIQQLSRQIAMEDILQEYSLQTLQKAVV